MPRGPRGERCPGDVVGAAVHVAKIATGEIEETTLKQLGKSRAGKAGARTRVHVLTPKRRSEIAQQAAQARWAKV